MMKRRGSITIFVTISMTLIASVILAMLEGGRMQYLKTAVRNATELAVTSPFGGYDSRLWENCHVLGLNVSMGQEELFFGDMEQEMWDIADTHMNPMESKGLMRGDDFLRAGVSGCRVTQYRLLTDDAGWAYRKLIAGYMKYGIADKVIDELQERYSSQSKPKKVNSKESVQKANKELKDQEKAQKKKGKKAKNKPAKSKKDNPLKIFASAQKKGLLTLLLGSATSLSEKSIDQSAAVSGRKLLTGDAPAGKKVSRAENILADIYYEGNFHKYIRPNEAGALSYELEYLLYGREDDVGNLLAVCTQMLLFREAANMAYLLTDGAKQAEAEALATALAGWTLMPAVVEAVKIAILAAWSFAESVLDIRTLLQGEKVPIFKTADTWTLGFGSIATCLSLDAKAKSVENGISYSDYLNIFLFAANHETLAMHAMDLQELHLRTLSGYESFQMDHIVVEMKTKISYQGKGIFMPLIENIKSKNIQYDFPVKKSFSYVKAGA